MKRTTKQPRKALATPTRLGLLAAVSGLALSGAATSLSAQSAGDTAASGGYSTSGIAVPAADVYGSGAAYSQGLQPIGVGPAGALSGAPIGGGAQSLGAPRAPALGTAVRRGRWVTSVTPFVETSVTYSDNIDLAPEGFERSDTVFSAGGGVVFGAQSERVTGQLSLRADYDHFLDDTNDDGVRVNANTAWSAAVVPNLFYIDAGGGVSEFYDTGDDRFSGNQVANSDNRSRAYYGFISPSLRKNIGGWANAELRYTGQAQVYDDDDLEGGYSNTFRAAISGDPRKFRRFGWQAVTEYEVFTPEDDDIDGDELNRWTSYVSVDVPVSRTVALTGTAGYDHFSDDVADSDVTGVFGNAGVRWQPNNRFAARAYGGWRYDGVDFGAEASYVLRESIVAGLNVRRGIQFTNFGETGIAPIAIGTDANGRTNFLDANGNRTQDRNNAAAVNPLTGQLANARDLNQNNQDDDAIVDTVQAFVTGQHGKTGWNASIQAAQYDYGSAFGTDETIIAANASVRRNLTSRLGLEVGAGLTSVQYDDAAPGTGLTESDFETLSLGVGLDYQLTEIVNVFGRYTYSKRFADLPQDEFTENAAQIGVNASF